ncbi:MAG: DUF2516 family protein [Candidatus Nanopelagicales bacterium]
MNWLTDVITLGIGLATLVACALAFLHCLRARPDAFPAVGRQSKNVWLALTGGATLLSLVSSNSIGLIGIASIVIAGVYLLDIKPKITEITSGR